MNFKTKVGGIIAALFAFVMTGLRGLLFGPPVVRARTCDVAIPYRMGAGYAGDINRTHPFSALAVIMNTTSPARAYGEAMLWDTDNGVRTIIAADQSATAVNIAGILVRPYPTQQTTGGMSSPFGSVTPNPSGVHDILREGYAMVKMKAGVAVKRGDPVFVWAVATAGANIQGEYQAAASAGNTVPIANARFMGPADASGIVEIEVRAE